jgi:hypothetical protein
MSKKTKFKPGDTVCVVGERNTSKIRSILIDVNGALLETEIGGFRSWNLDELRLVKNRNSRNKMAEQARAKARTAGILRWSKRRIRGTKLRPDG